MQADEIRELKDAEIRDRVNELEEERFRLRFRSATETLEQPLRLRVLRRELARMKTVIRERELGKAAPVKKEAKAKAATGGKTAGKTRARGGSKS